MNQPYLIRMFVDSTSS